MIQVDNIEKASGLRFKICHHLNMELKIRYIGNDVQYWKKIQKEFLDKYEAFDPIFSRVEVSESFVPEDVFIKIYEENIHIIYLDYALMDKECLYLAKLLTRNNETRLKSVVGLHKYADGFPSLSRSILAGVRLNHYKSSEMHDAVYDPVSLLDVNFAQNPHYVRGGELDLICLKQVLRVSYIEDDKYHVETNSLLVENQIIEVDTHPLHHLSESKRFFVKNFSKSNLYYNSRFCYDLEFTYVDSDYFRATESSWLTYKKYRGNPLGYKEDTGLDYDDLYNDVVKRKSEIRPMRKEIRVWIQKNKKMINPKRVKILVVDGSLNLLRQMRGQRKKFPYSINIQTHLTGGYYQIERTRPQFFCYRHDEDNNTMIELEKIIEKIKSIENYEPYILVFSLGNNSMNLQMNFSYQHIMAFKNEIDLEQVKDMASILDKKLHLSDNENRVYLQTSSKESVLTIDHCVSLVGMTESILYFESVQEIPMWTTFIVEKPIRMLLTVVPHKESGDFRHRQNCYRSLINGVGESEVAQIRTLINKSLEVEE